MCAAEMLMGAQGCQTVSRYKARTQRLSMVLMTFPSLCMLLATGLLLALGSTSPKD